MRHFFAPLRALLASSLAPGLALLLAGGFCLGAGVCSVAGGAEKKPLITKGPYNPDHATVELFAALDSGEIDVKFIPQDSTVAKVLIENRTDKPLNVKLPAAFAGVPVLGQFFGRGQGQNNPFGGQQGQGQQGGQNQSTGGGFNQQQGNGQNGQGMMQGNFFNVPAERVGKLKVALVCLEHGKPQPRAAIPYKIIPIASYTDNPEVAALCAMLGEGQMSQKSAQFAAWHLANEMSVAELSNKRIQHLDGSSEPFFTPEQVKGGKSAIAEAASLAKRTPATPVSAAKGASTAGK